MSIRIVAGIAGLLCSTSVGLSQPGRPDGDRLPEGSASLPQKARPFHLFTTGIPPAQSEQSAESAPSFVNPAAPPGFRGPVPTYPVETQSASPGRFWASGEWLYWATSGQPLPVLGTGASVGTSPSLVGALGSPNTGELFGGNRTNKDFRNGYRLNAGWWFDDARTFGIEGDFFFLQDSRQAFAIASNGSAIIGRPFVNAITGTPDASLVSFPGIVGGSLAANATNSLIGGGINAIHRLAGNPCGRLNFLIGYRYWNVSDGVDVNENATVLPGSPVAPGTQSLIFDRFQTSNNFHGGLIGLSGEKQMGRWFVSGRASVAFGANFQSVNINGSTTIVPPGGAPAAYAGGLYALPSNIGHHGRTAFAVVPEVGVRTGVQVTEHARLFVGYNFLYMSNVVRAGDQIDPRVNPNLLAPGGAGGGQALPAVLFKTTDFWAQGISIGAELRY